MSAEDEHGRRITLPVVGAVTLPEPQQLAFYAVLVSLGVLEIADWPVAGVVGLGHQGTSLARAAV